MLAGQQFGAVSGTTARIFGREVGRVDDTEDGSEVDALGPVDGADLDHAELGAVVVLEWQGLEAGLL